MTWPLSLVVFSLLHVCGGRATVCKAGNAESRPSSMMMQLRTVVDRSGFPRKQLPAMLRERLQGAPEVMYAGEGQRRVNLAQSEFPALPPTCPQAVQFSRASPVASARSNDFPVDLSEVAVPEPRRHRPRAWAVPVQLRAALRSLFSAFPHAKWYYVGDEDAVINLDGLRKLLSQYDPSVPTMVASNGGHSICQSCGACPEVKANHGGRSLYAFFGGTGQVMSAGLLAAVAGTLDGPCKEAQNRTLDGLGDLENTCHLARLWQPSFRFVPLKREQVTWPTFMQEAHPFVVAHHLCPEHITELLHVNRRHRSVQEEPRFIASGENSGCGDSLPGNP
eukprot:CAMPEP_0179142108 /NCGR_PEP_ID=MMETSP0796-20121207/68223_1 /TAXON_ID=73915 /ORGANISM="Pyrodinium bahamense, Strain pbaha01" /LENGTH=334 /DNA_ID=CAMNT_0020841935 /DNA_START=13 /DNA_END=1018 /DNA_ORIENTATION=-